MSRRPSMDLSRIFVITLALFCGFLPISSASAKDDIRIDIASDPASLDPQLTANPDSIYVYRNIFDNLLTRNDQGEIVPNLALSWKHLSDTEVEFTLRDDVYFHDGSKLGPEDVAFSVRRITDPQFGAASIGHFRAIVGADATGPNTVKLTTQAPYPLLLAQLVKLSVVPKAYVERVGNEQFNAMPVGSGPYKFVSRQQGVNVVLERNDKYWGVSGPFATAEFRSVPDQATRLADLQAGAADLVVALNADMTDQLDGRSDVKVLSVLTERTAFIRLNLTKTPTSDIRVRQAIAHAIDRDLIVSELLKGKGAVLNQLIPPVSFGWVKDYDSIAEYNPEKARALLSSVGADANIELDFLTAPYFDQRVVVAIQQMLMDVGFKVSIEVRDFPSWMRQVSGDIEGQPRIFLNDWSCACQDADGLFFPIFHSSSQWSKGTNNSAQTDAWIETGRTSLDPALRERVYRELAGWIGTEIPIVPMFQMAVNYGAARNLEWQPTSNESMFLNRMKWKAD